MITRKDIVGKKRTQGTLEAFGLLLLWLLFSLPMSAQIKIGGNVYGGGNQAEVKGNTNVTVQEGDIDRVFGGARMANVGGHTSVNITNTTTTAILINQVYGGNDIAGTIGTGTELPEGLTAVKASPSDTNPKKNDIDYSWNAFVHIGGNAEAITKSGAEGKENTQNALLIGSLFAGGNGAYFYNHDEEAGTYNIYSSEDDFLAGEEPIASNTTGFAVPNLDKTYLEITGGSIGQAFGGGNMATVTTKTVIHVDNLTKVVTEILQDGEDLMQESDRLEKMELNPVYTYMSSDAFQIGSLFGGNNQTDMAIRPTWNLQSGSIRNLYSGGNRGAMTALEGLLLEIDPAPMNTSSPYVYDAAKNDSTLRVDNIYGGCRMGNVRPEKDGVYTPCMNLTRTNYPDAGLTKDYDFPNELSARILVCGGDVNNVYGGNDVTGTVYGGNAIGIYTSIRGDVYGGGNGSYPYPDRVAMKGNRAYGDYYFGDMEGYETVTDALNAYRPNAEQVSIRLRGVDSSHPTIIHGSVFVGGNCATLAAQKKEPLMELKVGSYVIADKVFMGNNGKNMIDSDILALYADDDFSSLRLTDPSVFAEYMEGVCMKQKADIVFEADYVDYSSYFGSFYCGGNVGSMAIPGNNVYRIKKKLNIYDRLVGGCNAAYVPASDGLNATYDGGILGSSEEREDYTDGEGNIRDRLEIDLENLTITPLRWNDVFTAVTSGTTLTAGKEYYETTLRSSKFVADGTEVADAAHTYYTLTEEGYRLIWNTAKWSSVEDDFMGVANHEVDDDTRLLGGNVYGGCDKSGHVNGNVVININQNLLEPEEIFGTGTSEFYGRAKSGVDFEGQRDDLMAIALGVFGGGCGEDTEVWGSTTVNLNQGYAFQIFGGGEQGWVGKRKADDSGNPVLDENDEYIYEYSPAYSSTVNLNGTVLATSSEGSFADLAETEYIYGAGNEGGVSGNAYVNLGYGRIYDAFGGASNADVLGHVEVHIGRQPNGSGGYKEGFPWIRDNVYGGNDFGGTIYGSSNHAAETTRGASVEDPELLTSSTFVKYIQGRVDTIFGGSYGSYDYADRIFYDYTNSDGSPKTGFSFPRLKDNSFVYFQPVDNSRNSVSCIFGGSEGFVNHYKMNNSMQKEAYVLIDDIHTTDDKRFEDVNIYGGGSFAGVGSHLQYGAGRTVVDLFAGKFHDIYGGSNKEGMIGFSHVNVPAESTVKVNSIFGGSRGYSSETLAENPELSSHVCDIYVTSVDFHGANTIVEDAIYGGNENCRIACDTYLNIMAPVVQSNGYQATIYGAGYGSKTVSGRTNIFMNNGSNAYKVFGGGRDGHVYNYASLARWLTAQYVAAGIVDEEELRSHLAAYRTILENFGAYLDENPIKLPDNVGTYANSSGVFDGTYTNDILPASDDPLMKTSFYNTNVHIMQGGNVSGYAYGGGFGSNATVSGTTYIELKGGNVDKDVYGGGQGGNVWDEYALGHSYFTPATHVNIEGGMCRNAYGGGYLGHVGYHVGDITTSFAGDRLAEAHVVIGKAGSNTFTSGKPAVMRNVYGGGEGGSVYGISTVTLNNGMIGYRYKNTGTELAPKYEYVEELDDKKPNDIEMAGNVFGGGYVVNSYVDATTLNVYGGTIRGSLYGGGEIGPIGRGTMKSDAVGGLKNGSATIYKPGKTQINMYGGRVLRNIFGGGRGKDSWGGDGTMYMEAEALAVADLKSKGYIFGQTEVNIFGGEVGSEEGMVKNYGNVFGGGDEGSVYSAYQNESGNLCIGKKDGVRYDGSYEGYYYKYEGGAFIDHDVNEGTGKPEKRERYFTEDCKVLVEPHCLAKERVTIDEHSYLAGEYVPTAALNKLKDKATDADRWGKLDDFGIIIHNAVFAGGNIGAGSTSLYVNEKTVYGNATATIHDVYNRDLITVGTGQTGGLYGDGNLTFVDGYRELNITNYGTDYYHIAHQLPYSSYELLPPREQAYYEVKYRCKAECTDVAGTTYKAGSTLPMDELLVLFTKSDGTSVQSAGGVNIIVVEDGVRKPNSAFWEENGVVSTYAGRLLNTIQRADFCGVFGSRMVMKGAQDRVPETADYTNYTINRVREVSLNKMDTQAGDTGDNALHGNYFGLYGIVNYLGALTSDVDFYTTERTTSANLAVNPKLTPHGETFSEWKAAHVNDRLRNNGTCHNHLALASGVYLELTSEKSTGNDLWEKDWGPITGVIELDLINVQPGIGGGFVYAKNQHGIRSGSDNQATTLTALNRTAVTQWDFVYSTTEDETHQEQWETSGNFIHSSQTIIDDCYNISNRYMGIGKMPAHYWYISGQVYVYDQYISAYTGSPNAYSETVEIPLTIAAASHGRMTLMNVQPNLYAYYSSYNIGAGTGVKLGNSQKLVINDVTYQLNTPISYWDWYMLPAAEQKLFVEDTYVTTAACKLGEVVFPTDSVMLASDYTTLLATAPFKDLTPDDGIDNPVRAVVKVVKDEEGNYVVAKDKDEKDIYVAFSEVFHPSNNLSHDTGYLLTYNVTNPGLWNTWYTESVNSEHDSDKAREKNQSGGIGYEDGPTYHPTTSGLYGQRFYDKGSIVPEAMYTAHEALGAAHTLPEGQAIFEAASVVTKEFISGEVHYYPGASVSATQAASMSDYVADAYVSTSTIQLGPTEYIYVNDLMTLDEKDDLKDAYPALADEIDKCVVPAYYCTTAGLYGGDYYEVGKNYRGLATWSSMSETDREYFTFNYDALDLLIDPTYSGVQGIKYQYDSEDADVEGATANAAHYSLPTPVDYTASYNSDSNMDLGEGHGITIKRGSSTLNDVTLIQKNDTLSREVFEGLPNEMRHYAPITVKATGGTYYVVKESFVHGETSYAVGATLTDDAYTGLSADEKTAYITTLSFATSELDKDGGDNPIETTFYYCRENYTVNEKGEGQPVKSIKGEGNGTTYTSGSSVPVGAVISASDYSDLPNRQQHFTIHGISPMETSTLYVNRYADINDLSKEKVITVIYKYDYEESDESGMHITPVSERHVVNIHITFKSGVPIVEDIREPDLVLPGTSITMRVPSVTPGAYEIIGGGWELFEKIGDAESHTNGVDYLPNTDSLYWYQDGFYLAYYAKTYLGRTYSNHVPVSVANYHDLKKVLDDKTKHLHVDYDRTRLKRDSKIYINDYSGSSQNGLDLLHDFYDLSLLTSSSEGVTAGVVTAEGRLKGQTLLNNSELTGTNVYDNQTYTKGVKAGKNLEFFLRTDIDHTGTPWSTIGTDDICFKGDIHGDGHTISGLDHSLFYNLCGNVYNLGVTGSFTSAGVVDKGTGYVESCWVKTSETPAADVKAVFGNPSRTGSEDLVQVVNSYYPESNAYTVPTGEAAKHGVPIQKPNRAFYNGEVAYDLNNFYLYKRYSDHEVTSGEENQTYRYFTVGEDNALTLQPEKYYAANVTLCSSGYNGLKYVEDRFADGDFRFAAGETTVENEREWTETITDGDVTTLKTHWSPIWPDDYIFFGQKLTYGYAAEAHQEVPTAVARDGGRLSQNVDANRVYRAPAYYRNSTMGVAHFNPTVYLAQRKLKLNPEYADTLAYPNMTAIDFAGHYETNPDAGAYNKGTVSDLFYTPLLDDDGLLSIRNCDETQNLLVYAPSAVANEKTHTVLTGYFKDPAYSDYYDNSQGYRLVDENDKMVYGHLIQSDLTATNDHFLVDKQDFNCPIAYTFDADHLMWYQRRPADQKYVDHNKGWQVISLPFTAELVTTNQKGEITHFYSGSTSSANGTGTKIGHEYWLRELKDGSTLTLKSEKELSANFTYPTAAGEDKHYTNTFLWDYYYKNEIVHDQKDANADTYLEYRQYYEKPHTHAAYPLLTVGTPYILGLPGPTYYEFDLSGRFEAQNTAASITRLGKQIITFASEKAEAIGVSDSEMAGTTVTYGGYDYTFRPSYMNESLAAGTNSYVMDFDGNSFDQVPAVGAATSVSAFRPYFTAVASSSPVKGSLPGQIVFGSDTDDAFEEGPESALDGTIEIFARGRTIITRSHMKEPTTVRIVNIPGITLADFVLEPGKTVETPVQAHGTYIVNKKKIFVR